MNKYLISLFNYARPSNCGIVFASTKAAGKKKTIVEKKKPAAKGFKSKTSLSAVKPILGGSDKVKTLQEALFKIDHDHLERYNNMTEEDKEKCFIIEYAANERRIEEMEKMELEERNFILSKFKALKELYSINPELYQQAIEPDYTIYAEHRPMTFTPPRDPLFKE